MYTCTICKKPQPSNVPSRKVPTQIREVEYQFGDRLTLGNEIVREIVSCHDCPPPKPQVVGPKKELLVREVKKFEPRHGRFESPRHAKMED